MFRYEVLSSMQYHGPVPGACPDNNVTQVTRTIIYEKQALMWLYYWLQCQLYMCLCYTSSELAVWLSQMSLTLKLKKPFLIPTADI